ncbi:hypothetical protein EV363DRAFT_1446278 [Boletus edulis]|nr:hypothetical protein EV363DRAFT_1446278 [Boletus edulis]
MNPHRIYSSIYKQLIHIRPNVERFPNLTTLGNSREKASHWVNIKAPEIEVVLWNPVMNRLFLDAPLVEHIHFEGSPNEPLHSLTPLPTTSKNHDQTQPSRPKRPAQILLCTLRICLRIPVFPSLRKLIVDGSPSHAIEFVRLLSSPVLQDSGLLMLLADKYRGVFRALKIQHPLLCHDQAGLESFLRTVRTLADAGVGTLLLNLIVGWQELTREVQDMIELSKWTVLRHFRITSRRASPSWSRTAGNAL